MAGQIIIGLTGKAGAGKNTVADIMCQLLPTLNQVAFATKVKEVYKLLTGEKVKDSLEWKNELVSEYGMTRREMLQRIGTDCLRDNLHQDVWVNALMSNLTPWMDYVITDVRFPNEVEAIRKEGGVVFRVERPGFDSGTPAHVSESALDGMDFPTIVNDSDLYYLRNKVMDALVAYFITRNKSTHE